jgi:hypothetical protein
MSRPASPPAAIFWSHVDVDGPLSDIMGTKCWMWTATTNGGGYGQFDVAAAYGGGHIRAHRFAWELFNGPIPDGPTIDHLCRNTLCVKPAHRAGGLDERTWTMV